MAKKYFKANIDEIDSLCIARGWSREALAREAIVSTRTLDYLMAGGNGTLKTFVKIAKAFKVPNESILIMDGQEKSQAADLGKDLELLVKEDASGALPTEPGRTLEEKRNKVALLFEDESLYKELTENLSISDIIKQAIDSKYEVTIISIKKGSIIVELELSEEDLLRLVAAFTETRLDGIHVDAIRLPATTGPLAAGLLQIIHPSDAPTDEMTIPVTPEMTLTRTPTKALAFSVEEAQSKQTKASDKKTGEFLFTMLKLLGLFVIINIMTFIIYIFLKKYNVVSIDFNSKKFIDGCIIIILIEFTAALAILQLFIDKE